MKILDERPVPFPAAKKALDERKKKSELAYEQKIALEHLNRFTKITMTNADKLIKALEELGYTDKQAVEVCNIMPENKETLELVLSRHKLDLDDEKIKKTLGLVAEYVKA